MLCMYSDKISILCGINAALIAGYIWNESKENAVQFQGKNWFRCSKRNLCVVFSVYGRESGFKRTEKTCKCRNSQKMRVQLQQLRPYRKLCVYGNR